MKRCSLLIFSMIGTIVIFGIVIFGLITWLCLQYETNYKKTVCDTSISQDGKYELTLQAVGEPDWPFGAASGRLILMEGDKKISQTDFELRNDGGSISSGCWRVTWYEDFVEVILSGEEQEDEQFILYFDGRSDIQYLSDTEDQENDEELQATIINEDYAEVFQSIEGCAVILDPASNTYVFYNEDKCRTRVSPNSTFKVISTLIGLHQRVVKAEDSKMGYDGTYYPVETWNADLSLAEAFQSSCIWYFRKVIDEVGVEETQQELTELSYGNCDISEWRGSDVNSFPQLNGFWLESSLLISPIEQVEVLRNIVEGKTVYTESEVEILKNIMLVETDDSEKVYGKTGTGTDGTAWFIGFAENEDGYVYFAIYLDDDISNEINGAKAQKIALYLLKERENPAERDSPLLPDLHI